LSSKKTPTADSLGTSSSRMLVSPPGKPRDRKTLSDLARDGSLLSAQLLAVDHLPSPELLSHTSAAAQRAGTTTAHTAAVAEAAMASRRA
jgi:hypothetical protein